MTFPDVIPEGQSSLTDTGAWREECRIAALDLSRIRDGNPVFDFVVSTVTRAEERYGWIADSIKRRFGTWYGWNVLEVGGGYGGQARTMLDRYPCTYSILDLPEPLVLQRAYLAAHGYGLGAVTPGDLFISNYALTEMVREWQDHYLAIAHGYERGYVIWNGQDQDTYTMDEFAERAPAGAWVEESFIDPRNGCYVWGAA